MRLAVQGIQVLHSQVCWDLFLDIHIFLSKKLEKETTDCYLFSQICKTMVSFSIVYIMGHNSICF